MVTNDYEYMFSMTIGMTLAWHRWRKGWGYGPPDFKSAP